MANLNKVLLIGRLTRDPELRYIQSGSAVTEFGLATNREWTTPQGEKKEQTCFVDVVVYGKGAEIFNQYMKKGRQVFIEGRLDFSEWKDKDGNRKSKLRVVSENFQFLDSGQKREAGGGSGSGAESAPQAGDAAVREPYPSGRGGSRGGSEAPYRGGDAPPGDDLDFPPPSNDLPF
jgi:single-strand DNA-binding protein